MHECVTTNLIPVLVWSKDHELTRLSIKILNDEFNDNLVIFSYEEVPNLIDKVHLDEIESEVEKYDFHVIKIDEKKLTVIFLENSKFELKRTDNLETDLELAARKIIHFK